MVWRLLLGTVALAVVLLPPAPSLVPLPLSAQGTERVEFREPPPSCEQAIKELGLEGQPVHCIEPPASTYDPPRIHGKYRLYPESYVGPLTYEDMPDSAPPGVVSGDIQAIAASSLYLEPAWLPEGYARSSVSTRGYDSEHVIVAVYTGPGDPIRVNRVRRFTWPIDIILPAGESFTIFETPVLEGIPAVLYYPKPGSVVGSDLTVLSFVDGNVETTVLGDHLHPDMATRIALSLICGASCVPPSSAVGAPGALAVETARTSAPPSLGFIDDEHRVISGLAITRVMVTSWWDHGSSYAEAALDLQHPDGYLATGGIDVYVMTWPWSGSGWMSFATQEYRHDPSYCDGRYVVLKDPGGNVLGRLTYVHLAQQAGVGETWYSNAGTWTIRYIGKVATSQHSLCVTPYYAHLHQGQTVASQRITYNTGLPHPYGIIDPTNDPANKWMHRVILIDSDGDGCSDSEEGAMGFNPHNYWDVYDVPVPAYPDPTPNGPKNTAVAMDDVLAVLFYVGTYEGDGGSPNANGVAYDSDKGVDTDADTVVDIPPDRIPDGQDYDRSPSATPNPPWDAGSPDDAVAMDDVLAVLAQTGLSCIPPP